MTDELDGAAVIDRLREMIADAKDPNLIRELDLLANEIASGRFDVPKRSAIEDCRRMT